MNQFFNSAAWGTTATTNLISLVLVIVTGLYVALTWRIASANKGMLDNIREQYRDSLRPVIVASLRVRHQVILTLVIENVGRSPAYQVRVNIDRDFFQFARPQYSNIRDYNLFTHEIPVFAPGMEFPIDLAQGFNLDKEIEGRNITPSRFNITISYASKDEEFEETTPVDLTPLFNTHHPKRTDEWLEDIAKHLKKIADAS